MSPNPATEALKISGQGVLLLLRQIGKTFGKFCLCKALDGCVLYERFRLGRPVHQPALVNRRAGAFWVLMGWEESTNDLRQSLTTLKLGFTPGPHSSSASLPLQFFYTLGCFRLGEILIEWLVGFF
jgi:hypothetical protein